MDDFHSLYGRYPDVSVCDAGYGSEENYLYAFRHGIETFIKYNYFHNEETDGMYCPTGQRMERLSDARRVTNNGFVQTISRYKARNYKGCPLRCRCHRSRSERIVQVNHRLRKIKEMEREKLLSPEGLKDCRMWKPYLETSRTTSTSRGSIFVDLRRLKLSSPC